VTRRGFALAVSLLVLAIVSVMTLSLTQSNRSSSQLGRVHSGQLTAEQSADAGLARLMRTIELEPTYGRLKPDEESGDIVSGQPSWEWTFDKSDAAGTFSVNNIDGGLGDPYQHPTLGVEVPRRTCLLVVTAWPGRGMADRANFGRPVTVAALARPTLLQAATARGRVVLGEVTAVPGATAKVYSNENRVGVASIVARRMEGGEAYSRLARWQSPIVVAQRPRPKRFYRQPPIALPNVDSSKAVEDASQAEERVVVSVSNPVTGAVAVEDRRSNPDPPILPEHFTAMFGRSIVWQPPAGTVLKGPVQYVFKGDLTVMPRGSFDLQDNARLVVDGDFTYAGNFQPTAGIVVADGNVTAASINGDTGLSIVAGGDVTLVGGSGTIHGLIYSKGAAGIVMASNMKISGALMATEGSILGAANLEYNPDLPAELVDYLPFRMLRLAWWYSY
jgi:hypothetical protein